MNELQRFIVRKGLEHVTVEELKYAISQDNSLTQFEQQTLFSFIDICSAAKTAREFVKKNS
jgi:hypothetical protein